MISRHTNIDLAREVAAFRGASAHPARTTPEPAEPSSDGAGTPKVAVCIPLYNKERFVLDTIASVLAQTFTNFELLVQDNASSDNSLKLVRAIADRRLRVL